MSGKNTSPPPPPPRSLSLDFFRFSLNGSSRRFFFSFGELSEESPGRVGLSPGLREPGLQGSPPGMSAGLVPAPTTSLRDPDLFSSFFSFSGDLRLNSFRTLSVLDLLMVSAVWAGAQLLAAGALRHWLSGRTCRAGYRERTDVPTPGARNQVEERWTNKRSPKGKHKTAPQTLTVQIKSYFIVILSLRAYHRLYIKDGSRHHHQL